MITHPRPGLLDVRQAGGVTVARVAADASWDDEGRKALAARLEDLASRPGLVLDLGPVTFLDSTFVGLLVGLHKRARHAGGRLALCGLGAQAREVLGRTRLDRLLNLYPAEADALASFAPGGRPGAEGGRAVP
jgi:anti-sigma B factor antagonist